MAAPSRTRPRRAPQQRRATDTTAAILDAAASVMAERGHRGLTNAEVARKAQVSVATIYRYYPSREALVAEVVRRVFRTELATLAEKLPEFARSSLRVSIESMVTEVVGAVGRALEGLGMVTHDDVHLLHLSAVDLDPAVRFVEAALAPHRERLNPANLDLAALFVVRTVLFLSGIGHRDRRAEFKRGDVHREVSAMVSRYLLKPRAVAGAPERAASTPSE